MPTVQEVHSYAMAKSRELKNSKKGGPEKEARFCNDYFALLRKIASFHGYNPNSCDIFSLPPEMEIGELAEKYYGFLMQRWK
jgi:hypothetical protein